MMEVAASNNVKTSPSIFRKRRLPINAISPETGLPPCRLMDKFIVITQLPNYIEEGAKGTEGGGGEQGDEKVQKGGEQGEAVEGQITTTNLHTDQWRRSSRGAFSTTTTSTFRKTATTTTATTTTTTTTTTITISEILEGDDTAAEDGDKEILMMKPPAKEVNRGRSNLQSNNVISKEAKSRKLRKSFLRPWSRKGKPLTKEDFEDFDAATAANHHLRLGSASSPASPTAHLTMEFEKCGPFSSYSDPSSSSSSSLSSNSSTHSLPSLRSSLNSSPSSSSSSKLIKTLTIFSAESSSHYTMLRRTRSLVINNTSN